MNGSGKTNMLEALNLACGWGAFYYTGISDLRNWDSAETGKPGDNAEIICDASGEEEIRSEISISTRISARLNKERVSSSVLRTHIPALCFLPDDMNFIDGTPGIRRVFIDKLCSTLSIPYAKRLSDYKRLVRHRIKLLKIGKSPDITSDLLSAIGSWIWSVRSLAVRMINDYISNENPSMLSCFQVKMRLKLGGAPENDENSPCESYISKNDFLKGLEFYSAREMRLKVPLIGPHRDDISISIERDKDIKSGEALSAHVLSRGQKRRVVISIMLASGKIMETKLKRKPIFLLDEIFSELDEDARQTIADALHETGWQIFATSADSTLSNWKGNVYKLNNGEILL
jgi:DNA replication and repair protein RecF